MAVVDERMRAYYDRRAAEYDEWWLGEGLFEKRDRPGWAEEVRQLTDILAALPAARTLDVACGTGFLTRFLPGEVVAIDQRRNGSHCRREDAGCPGHPGGRGPASLR